MNNQIGISDVLQEFPSIHPSSFLIRPTINNSPLIAKLKKELPLKTSYNGDDFSLFQLFWLTYELLTSFVDWKNCKLFVVNTEWERILGCKVFTR
jgi:hypothetical protein